MAGGYLGRRVPAASSRTTQLDFNRAYSVAYSCPVPPAENRLSVAIPAGVQSDH